MTVKVIMVSWELLNVKLVESWRWGGESSDQEDETQGKIVRSNISRIKLIISKYIQVTIVN